MLFHKEEISTVDPVISYALHNPGHLYRIEFADGARFVTPFSETSENDNMGSEVEDESDPNYDEFRSIFYKIITAEKSSRVSESRTYNGYLHVNYRYFPIRIVDLTDNVVVYSEDDAVKGSPVASDLQQKSADRIAA